MLFDLAIGLCGGVASFSRAQLALGALCDGLVSDALRLRYSPPRVRRGYAVTSTATPPRVPPVVPSVARRLALPPPQPRKVVVARKMVLNRYGVWE